MANTPKSRSPKSRTPKQAIKQGISRHTKMKTLLTAKMERIQMAPNFKATPAQRGQMEKIEKRIQTVNKKINNYKSNLAKETNKNTNKDIIFRTAYLLNKLQKMNTSSINTMKVLRTRIDKYTKNGSNMSLTNRAKWVQNLRNRRRILHNQSVRLTGLVFSVIEELKHYQFDNSKVTSGFVDRILRAVLSIVPRDMFVSLLKKSKNPILNLMFNKQLK